MAFDWKSLIPILETAGGIAEMAIPGGAAFVPLTQAVESALNPLLLSIGNGKQDVTSEVMLAYGTMIAVLELLKQKNVADPALLTKIEAYIDAAQKAMAAWVQAGTGYNPDNYTPVAPIA